VTKSYPTFVGYVLRAWGGHVVTTPTLTGSWPQAWSEQSGRARGIWKQVSDYFFRGSMRGWRGQAPGLQMKCRKRLRQARRARGRWAPRANQVWSAWR